MPSLLVTGGAPGADAAWARAALAAGMAVELKSFHGHGAHAQAGVRVTCVPPQELALARPALCAAAAKLGKRPPAPMSYAHKLLARNLHVGRDALAMYALAHVDGSAGLGVAGGTGWACQLFVDARPRSPLYVYDLDSARWLAHDGTRLTPVDLVPHPSTYSTWAGVGARDAGEAGERAVAALMASSSAW
jgi:hypothetical protein